MGPSTARHCGREKPQVLCPHLSRCELVANPALDREPLNFERTRAPGYDVLFTPRGPVAQLGARLNGIQEVTGSTPVRSTILRFALRASYGWRALQRRA